MRYAIALRTFGEEFTPASDRFATNNLAHYQTATANPSTCVPGFGPWSGRSKPTIEPRQARTVPLDREITLQQKFNPIRDHSPLFSVKMRPHQASLNRNARKLSSTRMKAAMKSVSAELANLAGYWRC
jgi:hypothetical protein